MTLLNNIKASIKAAMASLPSGHCSQCNTRLCNEGRNCPVHKSTGIKRTGRVWSARITFADGSTFFWSVIAENRIAALEATCEKMRRVGGTRFNSDQQSLSISIVPSIVSDSAQEKAGQNG